MFFFSCGTLPTKLKPEAPTFSVVTNYIFISIMNLFCKIPVTFPVPPSSLSDSLARRCGDAYLPEREDHGHQGRMRFANLVNLI
jgi:hypothetical protein